MDIKTNNLINFSKEETSEKSQGGSNPSTKTSSSHHRVKQCKSPMLKNRLRTLILSKGMSEPDFFSDLGFSRQYWYFISWGIWETKPEDKIRIAKALDVDSSVIWRDEKHVC